VAKPKWREVAGRWPVVQPSSSRNQMCIAINRIIVDDSIYHPLVKGFVQRCSALSIGLSRRRRQ
jgi:acyl-CoA reductase-like NAD-dependent aldehyde dehydrogenase